MRLGWIACLWATWSVTSAWADGPVPRKLGLEVHGARASLTATFEERVDDGYTRWTVFLPPQSSAVGGVVRDRAGRHRMALVPAEAALAEREALIATPPAAAMATLVQISVEGPYMPASIDVLVARPTTLTLELELDAPACFLHDHRFVAIPATWVPALPPSLARRVAGDDREDELRQLCASGAHGDGTRWIGIPAPQLARMKTGPRIGLTASRISASGLQAAQLELALARTLSDIPDDLHTVFVIDSSRSMSAAQLEAARAIVRSYLVHAPRGSVQVVTFARTARALLARWSRGAATAQAIEQALQQVTLRNGSEVQAGLREAGTWLARVRGTRRIVLLSDELVADRVARIPTASIVGELPAGTLVHVVGLADDASLSRDDTARWADLAAATEGIAMRGGVREEPGTTGALELVRPTSLDDVRVIAPGWVDIQSTGTVVGEGLSWRWWGRPASDAPEIPHDAAPMVPAADTITIEGLLWGRRWSRTVTLGAPQDLSLARELEYILDPSDRLAIAALDAAYAINRRWSLVARWGGDGGYRDRGGGGTGWGTLCGCGAPGTIGHGSGTGTGAFQVTPLKFQLAEAVYRCTRDDVTIALTLETTLDEIVDVQARATRRGDASMAAPADAAAIETCVREAVWATDIWFSAPRTHAITRLTY